MTFSRKRVLPVILLAAVFVLSLGMFAFTTLKKDNKASAATTLTTLSFLKDMGSGVYDTEGGGNGWRYGLVTLSGVTIGSGMDFTVSAGIKRWSDWNDANGRIGFFINHVNSSNHLSVYFKYATGSNNSSEICIENYVNGASSWASCWPASADWINNSAYSTFTVRCYNSGSKYYVDISFSGNAGTFSYNGTEINGTGLAGATSGNPTAGVMCEQRDCSFNNVNIAATSGGGTGGGGGTVTPTPSGDSVTLGGYTFSGPFGDGLNYSQSGDSVVTNVSGSNSGGWKNYATTTIDTGTMNYYYKLTFKANKDYTSSSTSGEQICMGIYLYSTSATAHLTGFLKWSYDENETTDPLSMHEVCFGNTIVGGASEWTDNWLTNKSSGAGALKASDTITVEVYKFHGDTVDEYGIVVGGETFSYTLAESAGDTSTTHKIGFWMFHENAASGAATITVSDFVTCNDSSFKKNTSVDLNGSLPKNATVGAKVKVPSATATAAYGKTTTLEPKVTLNGKAVTLKSRSFTPTEAGEYKVTWSGNDAWGNAVTPIEKTFAVVADTGADDEDEETDGEAMEDAGCQMAVNVSTASLGLLFVAGAFLLIKKGLKANKNEG